MSRAVETAACAACGAGPATHRLRDAAQMQGFAGGTPGLRGGRDDRVDVSTT
ncbi:hypothetical protein BURCENBC7_AP7061 [Burkholderia cenocepacia BC7]|nr:hypothetical protein BURCENK562V_C1291 [Burkholderia cenocepacia K56-2Valvano]ERI25227.1 hypothetical protein BURCENBC7_AP7061 [Burkholderia cenocepacia BC7]